MTNDQSTNLFQQIIHDPASAIVVSHTGGLAGLLTWIGVLTPIIGFIAAFFGLVVGFYSMRIQYRKWKSLKHKK